MSIAYAAHDLRRNVRMVENTFFIVVLPAVLYVMFTALGDFSDLRVGHGNAGGYNMISMAVYGAVTATTSIAGSAAVEQARGWGRQIGLTPAPRHGTCCPRWPWPSPWPCCRSSWSTQWAP